jgi:hypothetical protein
VSFSRTELLFAGVMVLAAIGTVLVVQAYPGTRGLVLPPFAWPLFAALAFDLAVMPLVNREQLLPLRHAVRVFGVIAAAIVVILLTSSAH